MTSYQLLISILMDKLNVLHSAHQAFISTESSEKIKRALKAKTEISTSLSFNHGDSVYYKREGVPMCKGPGTVIGKEGQTVLVKCGLMYVRVHHSRLMLENSQLKQDAKAGNNINSNKSAIQNPDSGDNCSSAQTENNNDS